MEAVIAVVGRGIVALVECLTIESLRSVKVSVVTINREDIWTTSSA